eukprot:GSChrysophyteH2.ASY1.ANO1.970.1 assembled CDS
MVACWTLRLGSFLFTRICREGGVDSRFTEIKKSPLRFCTAFTLQGVWVFVTALPVFALNCAYSSSVVATSTTTNIYDYIGWTLWFVGFFCEVLADQQKSAFRAEARNKGKFIKLGLWSCSRHPNYFGEILLWTGVSIQIILTSTRFWSLAFSPLFVYSLLNYVSGVPLLEKASDEKWSKNADYQKYKEATPVLVPFIGKCG